MWRNNVAALANMRIVVLFEEDCTGQRTTSQLPIAWKRTMTKGGIGMHAYLHTVQYYETDQMGITHHSNYIRWMEEARVVFLDEVGWGYDKLEEMGLI